MRRNALAAAAVFGVLICAGRGAAAFCRTTTCDTCFDPDTQCPIGGPPLIWPRSCVSYSLQVDGSQQIPLDNAQVAADKAFDAWQEVTCPGTNAHPTIVAFDEYGPVFCKRHEYTQGQGNANVVVFREDEWPYANALNALALTTVTYNRLTGEIYDADMEINGLQNLSTSDPVVSDRYDLQSIITHEAGHFLGLAHTLDAAATMRAQYLPGSDDFRTLEPDDIDGICAIYPPGRDAPECDFTPRTRFSPECAIEPVRGGLCSTTPGAKTGSRALWLLPLASLLGMVVRRRARS
jgi:Matrixin